MALRRAGRRARGATLYVTLEPCNHAGRTPPCTEGVLASGIARVVLGAADPNSRVRGGGARRLARAGVRVLRGVLKADCRDLNAAYFKHAETGRPLVTLKCAVSLDGKVATGRGRRERISGPEADRFVHELRHASDAILVGVGTLLVDDPRLTTRRTTTRGRRVRGRDPLRVILDGRLRTPAKARVLRVDSRGRTVIATTPRAAGRRESRLRRAGAEIWRFPARGGRVDLRRVLRALGRRDVQSVLIEGGPRVAASALSVGLVDRLLLIVAPRLIGGDRTPGLLADALPRPRALAGARVRALGDDLLIEAEPGAPGR
jgi:diaminohydroxyphosphoribosylaminopyrimidine deaminase/5-amino-6-(5-phosphoribosylamino)uracil reductase